MTTAKRNTGSHSRRSARTGADQTSDRTKAGANTGQSASVSYLYDRRSDEIENAPKHALIEPADGNPAYVTELPEDGSHPGASGDSVTRIQRRLPKLGHRRLNVYIFETLGFHEIDQKYAHAVVRVEDGPGPVIVDDLGRPLIHVLHKFMQKTKNEMDQDRYEEKYELLKVGKIEVESHEYGVDIEDDRTLKSAQEGLRFNIVNHRKTGEAIRKTVSSADLYRMKTQAQWPDVTRVALDVESRHIAKVADYIRAVARQCGDQRYTISGLGPVKLDDGSGNIVFAGTTGGIEFKTGRTRHDVISRVGDKKGLAALGVSQPDTNIKLTKAYKELGKLLDCSPHAPASSAVLFGATMMAPLSTIELKHRVALFLHGAKMTGKTSLVKLHLQTQSPTARGYYETPVTVSARPGKGGTTTNGYLMVLQRAGGFLSLVDDYTVKGMDERTFYTRDEGLSVALGALYEGAPTKQTWGKLGPEFANTNGPQGSFVINGEIPGTKTGSTLSRMVEVDFPPVEFGSQGGLDHKLVKELHGDQPDGSVDPTSANLRHAAWSDATIYLLQHPEEAEKAYETATDIVNQWDLDLRTQDLWKRCITGLVYFENRARKVGLRVFNGLTEKLSDSLYHAAKKQSERLGTTTETTLNKIRRIWRELMVEGRISVTGPPLYNDDGYETRAWTEPFFNADHNDEESPYQNVPQFIESRTRLGFTQNGDTGWVPSKKIVGFLHTPPKKQGRKPAYPYRIELNSDQYGMLIRECSFRSSRNEDGPALDKKTVRDELINSGYARRVHSPSGRLLTVVDAEWLLSDSDELED